MSAEEPGFIEWSRLDKNAASQDVVIPGGFLSAKADGTIIVTVNDDYYSGTISRADAIKLLEALLITTKYGDYPR
jgi:hypothetical protein